MNNNPKYIRMNNNPQLFENKEPPRKLGERKPRKKKLWAYRKNFGTVSTHYEIHLEDGTTKILIEKSYGKKRKISPEQHEQHKQRRYEAKQVDMGVEQLCWLLKDKTEVRIAHELCIEDSKEQFSE